MLIPRLVIGVPGVVLHLTVFISLSISVMRVSRSHGLLTGLEHLGIVPHLRYHKCVEVNFITDPAYTCIRPDCR